MHQRIYNGLKVQPTPAAEHKKGVLKMKMRTITNIAAGVMLAGLIAGAMGYDDGLIIALGAMVTGIIPAIITVYKKE